jgi:hypothetical protein
MNIFDYNINKYFSKSIGNDLSLTKLEEWKGKQKYDDDTAIFSCKFF